MIRSRFDDYTQTIHEELRRTFLEDHTPRETAGSFSIGTFITMLPTLGVGLLAFFVLAIVFDRVSKLALFASVVVFNPVVKWGVYVVSFGLGVAILGPVEGVTLSDVSFSAGPQVVLRLLVGNLILAVIATVVSYVVVYRLAIVFETSELGKAIEEVAEKTLED